MKRTQTAMTLTAATVFALAFLILATVSIGNAMQEKHIEVSAQANQTDFQATAVTLTPTPQESDEPTECLDEAIDPNFHGYEEAEPPYTETEIEILAQTVYGEARGCSTEEQKLVVWVVFQRVDADGFGGTIEKVLAAPRQFHGYDPKNPIGKDRRAQT
jgi:spore germination cell wall hydrolase CwlJ-like protein